MALPPILGNLPIAKLFTSEKPSKVQENIKTTESSTPQDVVDISQTAQEKLEGLLNLSADNPEQVRTVAQESAQDLQETGLSLGLGKEPA